MSDPIRDAVTRAIISAGDDLLKKKNAEPDGPFDFYEAKAVLPPGKTIDDMIDALVRDSGVDRAVAEETYRNALNKRIAKSSLYQVALFDDVSNGFGEEMLHLSIKRLDREPIRDWRDLQRIKNAIVGEETEAFEIFPAESRLVDGANQYHLFCFRPGVKIPVGFDCRMVSNVDGDCGSKQRPFESPDALLPSRAQFSDVLRQLLAQIDLGGTIPQGLLNEARAMVNHVEHARQIMTPPTPTAAQRLRAALDLVRKAQSVLDPLTEALPLDVSDSIDAKLQEARDELRNVVQAMERADSPPGIHCDCWDNGEACCHCGSTSQNGNCDGDDGQHPCKAAGDAS